MENAPKSLIPILVFRNYSAVVAKFRFERLSGLVNPSRANLVQLGTASGLRSLTS
jgi:hypothetical protein